MTIEKHQISGPVREGHSSIRVPTRDPARVQSSRIMTSTTISTTTSANPLTFARRRQAKNGDQESSVTVEVEAEQKTSSRSARGTDRPSALPKLSSSISPQVKLLSLRPSPSILSRPSLAVFTVSGSTSTMAEPKAATKQRNVLRRKQSTISQYTTAVRARCQTASTTSSVDERQYAAPRSAPTGPPPLPKGYADSFPEAILGFTLPPPTSASSSNAAIEAHRQRADSSAGKGSGTRPNLLYSLATHDLPPSAIQCNASSSTASASTRFSDSPGPFSRTSTPTSMSSYSPGISTSSKFSSRAMQSSPARSRPPLTRRPSGATTEGTSTRSDLGGLPPLRESRTSSSSGSTVKPAEQRQSQDADDKEKKKLSIPPPSPPLRKSSMNFSRARATSSERDAESRGLSRTRSQLPKTSGRPSPEAASVDAEPMVRSVGRPGTIPRRPSRAGAPDLDHAPAPPVVQSNLDQLPTVHGHYRLGSIARISPHKVSPSPIVGQDRAPASVSQQRIGESSSEGVKLEGTVAPSASSLSSVSPPRANSRFGLFTRRHKTDVSSIIAAPPREKLKKKGPAAGTGHEGYGKFSLRGRSASTTSTESSWARSNSVSSIAVSAGRGDASSRKNSLASRTGSELDDFFSDRLEPKIITGSGERMSEEQRAAPNRNASEHSFVPSSRKPSVDSNHSGSTQLSFSNYSQSEIGVNESETSEITPNTIQAAPFDSASTLGSDHGNESSRSLSTLASRRSRHGSQNSTQLGSLRMPRPIVSLASHPPSPSVASHDTSLGSMIPSSSSVTMFIQDDLSSEGKEGHWLRPRKQEKRAKSPIKWNLFQRKDSSRKEPKTITELSTTVAGKPRRAPVHHSFLDSTKTSRDATVAEQAVDGPLDEEEVETVDLSACPDDIVTRRIQEHVRSILLPSPPALPTSFKNARPASPAVPLQPLPAGPEPTLIEAAPPVKRSRLLQVGRIPKVVSTRDRAQKQAEAEAQARARAISRQSFSQPFVPTRPTHASATAFTFTADETDLESHQRSNRSSDTSGSSRRSSARRRTNAILTGDPTPGLALTFPTKEFLTFSPKLEFHNSSSSDSGTTASLTAITAIIPVLGADPMEDEVWDEYDDLLDNQHEEILPWARTRQLQRRKCIHVELHAVTPRTGKIRRVSSTTLSPVVKQSPHRELGGRALLAPSELSPAKPDTPMSFTEFFAGYEERNVSSSLTNQTNSNSDRQTTPTSATTKTSELASSSRYSTCDSTIEDSMQEDISECMDEDDESEAGDGPRLDTNMNLRFTALMTSRWLSFGRVLFSPAHAEMESSERKDGVAQERVLVLDGLCNDDWSFYCALTYPSASVYNLSPSPSASQAIAGDDAWSAPTNHRQIHHPSLSAPFPFPRGFFTAVVLRFPSSASEAHYRLAISECKRVLRPGGHLEITSLDLDLQKMGSRTRRAVRALKVRMQAADPDVSLKPMCDLVIRLLGRRGFEGVNQCLLGVPAAGHVKEIGGKAALRAMLRDGSDQGEEGVGRMVAGVGRWWYGRCYEDGIQADEASKHREPKPSIWDDRAVLRECERKGTSFKLLVCYAQKPEKTMRRTVSV